jgi:hypothetical protein
LRGGTATSRVLSGALWTTRITQFVTDYAASPANAPLLNNVYTLQNTIQQNVGQFLNSNFVGDGQYNAVPGNVFAPLPGNLILKMAQDDTPVQSPTTTTALALLVQQMNTSVDSVLNNVVAAGSQTAVGSPNGSAYKLLIGTKSSDGLALEYVYAETFRLICTRDAQSGAVKWQESFSITGAPVIADTMSWLWPGGSGISLNLNAITAYANGASQDNINGNLLTNSGFDTFTVANTPDKWPITTGIVGTDILSGGSGNAYSSSPNCLNFHGDGATLIDVRQQFNNTGGTAGNVYAYTNGLTAPYFYGGGPSAAAGPGSSTSPQYGFSVWMKVGAAATGVITFSLVDGSGTVINDAQATANTISVNVNTLTTSYAQTTGTFRLPALLPSTGVFLRIKLTTALQSTKDLYIDNMVMTPMTQLYAGGPYACVFSAATQALINDQFTLAMTNTMGGFQGYSWRCFNMPAKGLKIPSNSSNTINENLIT